MDELLGYARNLTRAQHRIASFWADGPGSYTPPGHWNRIAADLAYARKLSELRSARVMALSTTAVADAGIACWEAKYYYMYPRPFQMDARIKTVVGLPNFPSYTSGHSTFSGAAATVLSYLFPEKAADLQAMANEASESRIYGCIHYRFDCVEGLIAGQKVGNLAVERGKQDGSP
jgi:membrane-associated phospholipid phosphatase